MKKQIKTLRIKIDELSHLVKALTKNFEGSSNQMHKCYDSLIFGKAWLGKVLGDLGTENPYGSGYKTKEDIVPTQDVSSGNLFEFQLIDWGKANHIEKIDWLRTEIEHIYKNIYALFYNREKLEDSFVEQKIDISSTNCYTHLCEARFWLGFELQRIKEIN